MASRITIDSQTVETYADRITAAYDAADADAVAAGLAWYGRAESTIAGLAQTYGISRDAAAGVVAVLSPRSRWQTNLEWAESVLRAAQSGAECPAVSMGANRSKAWSIANGADPESVVSGPKVTAFWANLRGDDTYVTVDVWAARAAGVDKDGAKLNRSEMAELQAAYRQAAERRGIPVAHLQAVVWVHVRGAAE